MSVPEVKLRYVVVIGPRWFVEGPMGGIRASLGYCYGA